jgi:hypothetical protein
VTVRRPQAGVPALPVARLLLAPGGVLARNVTGTPKGDRINGTAGKDRLSRGRGNDRISGRG